jgi:iron complex outermembrane receptor protein
MPASPLLTDSAFTGSDPRSVVQYTAGLTAKYLHNAYWTHSMVLGFDGYALAGLSDDPRSFLSSADSALRAAGASALRASLRFSSIGQRELGSGLSGALTLAAEHSVLRQRGVWQDLGGTYRWSHDAAESSASSGVQHLGNTTASFVGLGLPQSARTDIVELRSNTGLGAQVSIDAQDRVFLNGGLRLEHQGGPDGIGQLATLPTIGAAFANTMGRATLKLRAAWGKGIRWPDMPARPRTSYGVQRSRELAPEQQTGTEAGFDLSIGSALSFQVTRFDQTASGLIQDVATYIPEQRATGDAISIVPPEKAIYVAELQNVGEIGNRGWEMAATLRRGRLALAGTFGLVDSRVQQVAPAYTGDLQPGDRMLAVPRRTSSLTASWQERGWSGSLTAYRAADWVNYDRIALARAMLANDSAAPLEGSELRSFWREYDGITHIHAAFTRDLRRGLTLTLRGENLLDQQVGEPDNITVLPGRTVSVGVRASF